MTATLTVLLHLTAGSPGLVAMSNGRGWSAETGIRAGQLTEYYAFPDVANGCLIVAC
jgi:hypothetical protein